MGLDLWSPSMEIFHVDGHITRSRHWSPVDKWAWPEVCDLFWSHNLVALTGFKRTSSTSENCWMRIPIIWGHKLEHKYALLQSISSVLSGLWSTYLPVCALILWAELGEGFPTAKQHFGFPPTVRRETFFFFGCLAKASPDESWLRWRHYSLTCCRDTGWFMAQQREGFERLKELKVHLHSQSSPARQPLCVKSTHLWMRHSLVHPHRKTWAPWKSSWFSCSCWWPASASVWSPSTSLVKLKPQLMSKVSVRLMLFIKSTDGLRFPR